MGLAEVVPGVSGGTIALITGIYRQLVEALASFGPDSLSYITRPKAFIERHHLPFLLWLGLGMGLGILLFGNLMSYLLANYAPLVWAFFFGVILMSVWIIGRERRRSTLLIAAPLGLLFGLALLWLPVASANAGLLPLFFGGAVAVCAWLLPAVSGSYMLLVMGLYETVIHAVAEFDFVVIGTVALGCAAGLLVFAKLLAWLLARYYEPVLSLLTGFMLGSVVKLWPWQDAGHARVIDALVTAETYEVLTGQPGRVALAVVCAIVGGLGIWALSKVTDV